MILWWNLARAATPEELDGAVPAAQEQLETCARRGCAPRDGARAAWLVAVGTYEATGAADGALAASVRALDAELFAALPDVLQAAATEPLPWAAAGGVVAAEQVFAELFLFRAPPELGARLRALADEEPERVLDALALMRWDPRVQAISRPTLVFPRDEPAAEMVYGRGVALPDGTSRVVDGITFALDAGNAPDSLRVSMTLAGVSGGLPNAEARFEWSTQAPWPSWSVPRVWQVERVDGGGPVLMLAVSVTRAAGAAEVAAVEQAMEERRQRTLHRLDGGGARVRRRATDEALGSWSAADLLRLEMHHTAAERVHCVFERTSMVDIDPAEGSGRSAVVTGCGREAFVTYVDRGRSGWELTDDLAAREAAVRDLGCASIEVEFLGESARRIRGCGREAVYVAEVGGWRAASITP